MACTIFLDSSIILFHFGIKNSHNASIHHQIDFKLGFELLFIDIIDLYVTFNLNQIYLIAPNKRILLKLAFFIFPL